MSTAEFKKSGDDAFKARRFMDAQQLYGKAIATNPPAELCGTLYSNRAACWQSLNDFEKALADAEMCVQLRPTWLKGHFRKGVALTSLQRIDEAQKAFEAALKVEPNNEEVQTRMQTINEQLNQRNNSAVPARCKTATEAKQVGNSLFSAGKYEQAAKFYTRAIELTEGISKEKAVFYANRAACLQQTHMYSQMVDDCNAALENDPTNVKAYIRRAIAYEGMERWKLALDDYNKAKELAPGMQIVSQGVLRCQRAIRG